jgi:hypothetical protein
MDKIDWIPLKKFFGNDEKILENFMFMGTGLTKKGVKIYLYKHQDTRRYINLDSKGQTYEYVSNTKVVNDNVDMSKEDYVPITKAKAIKNVLS